MGRVHVEIMEPNPYLVASSVLFAVPTTVAAYNRHWLLYSIFLYMTIVSSIYHATKYKPLLYLDYPGCYALVLITGYQNWKTGRSFHWILGTSFCGILFWGGWMTGHLVFSQDPLEKIISHAGMHLFVNLCGSLTSYLAILDSQVKEL